MSKAKEITEANTIITINLREQINMNLKTDIKKKSQKIKKISFKHGMTKIKLTKYILLKTKKKKKIGQNKNIRKKENTMKITNLFIRIVIERKIEKINIKK